MAIFRLYPSQDTDIANYDASGNFLPIGISSSNVGASEILNLYQTSFAGDLAPGQAQAHVLTQFDLTQLPSAILTGGAGFFLNLFNAQHSQTLPAEYDVIIAEISGGWQEGQGLDQDRYTDSGSANWVSASLTATWVSQGGDINPTSSVFLSMSLPIPYYTGTTTSFFFQTGHEDLQADVSTLVMDWLGYGVPNNGFLIFIDPLLSGSDLYIKKFHSRQTHFPEKAPFLEARWADWTGSLSTSSLFLVTQAGPWSGSYLDPRLSATMTGTLVNVTNSLVDPTGTVDLFMYDLKPVYEASETPVFQVQAQAKDWNPATVASATLQTTGTVLSACYYRVVDRLSGMELVPFGTGALQHTRLSFNDQGNYFQFDMSNVPSGKLCRFDFGYTVSGSWTVVPGPTFRVR